MNNTNSKIQSKTVREHRIKVQGVVLELRRSGFELGLTITPEVKGVPATLRNQQVRELRKLLNVAIEEEQS